MVRLLAVLFWLGLIVGTYVTGNILGNWVVCLLALFFFVRSRSRRDPAASLSPTPRTGWGTGQSSAAPRGPTAAGMPLPAVLAAAEARWQGRPRCPGAPHAPATPRPRATAGRPISNASRDRTDGTAGPTAPPLVPTTSAAPAQPASDQLPLFG